MPSTQRGTVDINLIPTALVERTEIVTGGASAAYGSDAVAGVVNFILDKDFTGMPVDDIAIWFGILVLIVVGIGMTCPPICPISSTPTAVGRMAHRPSSATLT